MLFLFELQGGRTALHVGDFRYEPRMAAHPAIRSLPLRGRAIDLLYLDTTYCDPKYTFPPQARPHPSPNPKPIPTPTPTLNPTPTPNPTRTPTPTRPPRSRRALTRAGCC